MVTQKANRWPRSFTLQEPQRSLHENSSLAPLSALFFSERDSPSLPLSSLCEPYCADRNNWRARTIARERETGLVSVLRNRNQTAPENVHEINAPRKCDVTSAMASRLHRARVCTYREMTRIKAPRCEIASLNVAENATRIDFRTIKTALRR